MTMRPVLVRRWPTLRAVLAGPAIVVVTGALLVGCGHSQTVSTGPNVSSPPTTASIDGVSVFTPGPSDLQGLDRAFISYEQLPATCPVETVPGSAHTTTIQTTGISWAVASFVPAPSCKIVYEEKPANPNEYGVFYQVPSKRQNPPTPVRGVFERPKGGQWTMNSQTGYPFPCPSPKGHEPGPVSPALPPKVLTALHMAYASGCENLVVPFAPGR
ncbi:MAG: hypothetical protein M3063_03365 [Actinomycetota bacterium]|nr:hypothetical protein [Actinomycetota bacterium]